MKYLSAILLLFLASSKSSAYPEMIRHGYVNCLACHTTQQGGDLLSPYGKELGKELFSRNDSLFKTSTEPRQKNYWEIETPEWLSVGANARLLQTATDSSVASKGRFMIMQIDIDALFKLNEKVSAYTSLGRYEPSKTDTDWRDFVYTPRLWVRYLETFDNGMQTASLRVGRLFPTYGIVVAEHTYVHRRYLEFNPGQERLAAELAWSNENYQAVATVIQQRGNFEKYDDEKGYTFQFSKVFGKSSRAGVNLYRSTLSQNEAKQNKSFEGAFALIGITPEVSLLMQADKIYYPHDKIGFLDFIKLGYEYTQGVQLFATQEYFNANTEKTDPHVESFGVGVQYFPFPNFDVFATFKKMKDSSQIDEHQNVVWLIAHFYL